MGVLIPVNVSDLLGRAGHFPVPRQIVEKHETGVEVDALQNIICHGNLQQRKGVFLLLKLIVQISDEGIAPQQMLVCLPLIENFISLRRTADGVQHIAVTLAVHTLLESLDGQAQVDLIGGNILADGRQVCRLDRIQKHQKA